MSNARELALIEKWADIATPATPNRPTLSPTSPPALHRSIVKFCCCPQRRRYNLKQAKSNSNNSSNKSTVNTLHARNILVDSDFSYIDDVPRRRQDCHNDYDDCDYDCGGDKAEADDANDTAAAPRDDGNVALILMNQRNLAEQWRQDNKGNSSSNKVATAAAATAATATAAG